MSTRWLAAQIASSQPRESPWIFALTEEGRFVAVEWTWTATHSGPGPTGLPVTNRRISVRGASFAERENRNIKRITDYFDAASFFSLTA